MRTFQFRMATLLKVRQSRRDLCRQYLAQTLADIEKIDAELRHFDLERQTQIQELRQSVEAGPVDIDRAASRRYFAGRLAIEKLLSQRRRDLVQQQVELCRQALVRADQEVKTLEMLRDKQAEEFRREQERKQQLYLEESWQSVRLAETM